MLINFEEDTLPALSDIEFSDNYTGRYLILDTTSPNDNDTAYSIVPDTEFYRGLIDKLGLGIVGSGEMSIPINKLCYGLNHSERLLYKKFSQEVNNFISEKINNRFTEDDKVLRSSLNELGVENN